MKHTILLLLALLAGCQPAFADYKYRLDVHGASYHTNRCYRDCTKKYNEINGGVGVTFTYNRYTDLIGGYFNNSFDQGSLYLGANFGKTFGVFRPSIAVGAADGYEDITKTPKYKGWGPVVLPNLDINTSERTVLNVGYIPTGFAGKTHVFTVRFGIRF